jgi:hypothetical protein
LIGKWLPVFSRKCKKWLIYWGGAFFPKMFFFAHRFSQKYISMINISIGIDFFWITFCEILKKGCIFASIKQKIKIEKRILRKTYFLIYIFHYWATPQYLHNFLTINAL